MRSEFEEHFLSLKFATGAWAKLILDSCTFDSEQDGYLPNVSSVSSNNSEELVLYCCMLNTAYLSFKHQQSKVNDLQKQRDSFIKAYEIEMDESIELQKRLDAAFKVLSQLNDLDDEAHKRWKREACMFSQGESNAYEHAVRLLEQALKGGEMI